MAQPRPMPLILLERVLCAHAQAIAGARLKRGLPVAPRAVANEVLSLHRGASAGPHGAALRRLLERAIACIVDARAPAN
jgi:hypothetical protein